MDLSAMGELRQRNAILDFLAECVLETSITDESTTCFEALAEIAPGYFATLASSRHLGDNWVLKQSDYRKLLRFMGIFFQSEAKKTTLLLSHVDCSAIAKSGDAHHTLTVLKLVAVAAVLCQRKSVYIQRMMDRLPGSSQITLKQVLEDTMKTFIDADETATQDKSIESFESQTAPDDTHSLNGAKCETLSALDVVGPKKGFAETGAQPHGIQEELERRIRHLESQKLARDETINALKFENNTLREAVQEQSSKLDEISSQNQRLADEIDILQPQVQQLYQSQAEISILKQHVEDFSFEGSKKLSSEVSKDISWSLPISDEDMDMLPFFEDSETSTNPMVLLDGNMNGDTDLHDVVNISDDADDHDSVVQLKCQLELLIESQQLLDSENENLRREKAKLEAYAKRAVSRYQDQYLAAKHDLTASRAKVKEQKELIAILRNCIEQQLSAPMSQLSRRRVNQTTATKLKRTIKDYGHGTY